MREFACHTAVILAQARVSRLRAAVPEAFRRANRWRPFPSGGRPRGLPAHSEADVGDLPRPCAKVACRPHPRRAQLARSTTPVRECCARVRIPHACAQVNFVQQSRKFGSLLSLGPHRSSPRSHRFAVLVKTVQQSHEYGPRAALGLIIRCHARAVWPL